MAANGGVVSEELKRKVGDLFCKPNDQGMLGSPTKCVSVRRDWPCSLSNDNTVNAKGKDLSRCGVTSLAESGPPCTSLSSTMDARRVEELTIGRCENSTLAVVSSPHNSRLSQWNYLYHLNPEARYKSMNGEEVPQENEQLGVSKEVKRINYNIWNMKPLLRNNQSPQEVSMNRSIRDNKNIISCSTLPIDNKRQKTSSTCSFSQSSVKHTLKGKEVMYRNPEAHTGIRGALHHQDDDKLGFVTNSDALLKLSADEDKLHLQNIGKCGRQDFDDGINLKDWLISTSSKRDKAQSLLIFKQILEIVDFAHSQGVVLQDLRPSCFMLLPSNRVKYIGSSAGRKIGCSMNCILNKRSPMEDNVCAGHGLGAEQQKLYEETKSLFRQPLSSCTCDFKNETINRIDTYIDEPIESRITERTSSRQKFSNEAKQFMPVTLQLEEKWYTSPEQLSDRGFTFSSNIYSLGVLLFEFLCNIEPWMVHSAVMIDLRHRILPPKFLSENPKEAGFCLWLLHPEPSCRPTARMILQSEFICESEELNSEDNVTVYGDCEDESDKLLLFLTLLREGKHKHVSKLAEDLGCLEDDIHEVERRLALGTSSAFPQSQREFPELREKSLHFQDLYASVVGRSVSESCIDEAMLMKNLHQLEDAYFSMRSRTLLTEIPASARCDKDVLKSRGKLSHVQNDNEEPTRNQRSVDSLGSFFEGLSHFARYSKFEVRGTLRNGDLLNSANVICSLSFDRDEDYIAVAGVSKKIKIFEFSSLLNDSADIHYPIVEMSNKSKLSCVCWNNYIKNYLASTDYDGVVQMWDAGTGQIFSQYKEHQKRAWSVDFSQANPKKFASGSDDCSVKLWSINEKNSLGTILNPANVCCVQFSAYSAHLLVLGSADYKIYGYDLRHTRIPWCTLAGHEKAVSYVKFLDAEAVVSSSTDNTMKLWDLNKTSSTGLSSGACGVTFRGHSNEKNFVGLSTLNGYIACGSETNEVYCYSRSLPMPIISYKFGSIDPISGHEKSDNNGQFVSSVCWRQKSNMVVAANSSGTVKLLQMV
ncbi:SPA1 [Quillaja saponaria]|uniref:SPA1 n=1 Tax=Quillaja saponaria TaxID=32244 RepID=A0AAD7LQV3_QUISA|nr:SPA1 [Quillaja saponaria]